MKFRMPSFARLLLAFTLVVSVPSCDGIDNDSENTETPGGNDKEEGQLLIIPRRNRKLKQTYHCFQMRRITIFPML